MVSVAHAVEQAIEIAKEVKRQAPELEYAEAVSLADIAVQISINSTLIRLASAIEQMMEPEITTEENFRGS